MKPIRKTKLTRNEDRESLEVREVESFLTSSSRIRSHSGIVFIILFD